MQGFRAAAAAIALALGLAAAGLAPQPAAARAVPVQGLSAQAAAFTAAVAASGDARGRPYAVVDKGAAWLWLFDARGRRVAGTPVLLGEAPGDDSAKAVGLHAQLGHVPRAERTTPAGRFEGEAGRNASGEQVLWLDWEAAFAIHRLRPGRGHAARARQLAGADPALRRMSWGCVVVPAAFFTQQLAPWFAGARPLVYVMPEGGDALALLAAP